MEHGFNIKNFVSYSDGGIISKVIVKSGRMNVTLFCMAAGTDMSEHTSAREGMIYVIEGDGLFTLANQPIQMGPGVLIYMAANQPHSISAGQNTSFLLTLIA